MAIITVGPPHSGYYVGHDCSPTLGQGENWNCTGNCYSTYNMEFAGDIGAAGGTTVYFAPWEYTWGYITEVTLNGVDGDPLGIIREGYWYWNGSYYEPRPNPAGTRQYDWSIKAQLWSSANGYWQQPGYVKYQHLSSNNGWAVGYWLGPYTTTVSYVSNPTSNPLYRWVGSNYSLYWTGPHTHWEATGQQGDCCRYYNGNGYAHHYWVF